MNVILFATLREIAGTSRVTMGVDEPRPLLACLEELATKFGDEWRETVLQHGAGLSQYVRVYLNGEEVARSGDAMVSDRDEVQIFVPMAGG